MKRLKKILKWLGIVLAGLIVLGVAGVVAASCVVQSHADRRYEVADYDFEIPSDEASLAEGERLYHARGCAECHGEGGEGRVLVDAPPFLLAPPNITRVGRALSPSDWHRIVRHGVYGDGRPVFFMPAHEYNRMPDGELSKIVAHVRTFEESSASVPASELRPLGNVLFALGVLETMYPAELVDHEVALDPAPDAAPTAEFGEYLTRGCMGCHGEHFSGGPIPGAPEEEIGIPSNITMHETGLRSWDLAGFQTALRTGRRPNGTTINPRFMPWRSMHSHMTDTELEAMWAYLQTVPPRPFGER